MEKVKEALGPAIKFSGIIGSITGFIGDVLSPLGPIIDYLFYTSLSIFILSLVLLISKKIKKYDIKKILFSSLVLSIIFGVFGVVNQKTEQGVLGDNFEFVSQFQSSLNIIDKKLDGISDQIEVVDNKIDNIDSKIDDVKEISYQTNESLNTISYQQEEILTSIEDLNNIGSELRDVLGIKTIQISARLKLKVEEQLKTDVYKNLFTHYNRRYIDYEYFSKKQPDEEFQTIAINKIPCTDIGYYRRASEKQNQNDYDAALKLADSALAINPKLYHAFVLRAGIKEAIKDNTALEDLNKAFNLKPNSFFINTQRGLYFMRNGDYQKAIIDFNRANELSNFRDKDLQSFLMASYWDQKSWSELSKYLSEINNQNNLIEFLKETYGNEAFTDTWASMFLLNTNNTADISYIKSDAISEIENVYFGYFLLDRDGYVPFSFTNKEGKYVSLKKEDYFGTSFQTIKKPIIDFNRLELDNIRFYVTRAGTDDIIQEIRNSQDKEIFTVIFKIIGQNGDGEIFYIEKGIERLKDVETAYGKNLKINDKGQIINW